MYSLSFEMGMAQIRSLRHTFIPITPRTSSHTTQVRSRTRGRREGVMAAAQITKFTHKSVHQNTSKTPSHHKRPQNKHHTTPQRRTQAVYITSAKIPGYKKRRVTGHLLFDWCGTRPKSRVPFTRSLISSLLISSQIIAIIACIEHLDYLVIAY